MSGNCVQELTLLDKAKRALANANNFDQIKDIRDKAEAVRKYAQSASLGLEIQNRAAEVKLRAERQAGKLLSQLMLRGGDRRSKSRHDRVKLDDLGISRNQSTRWQIQAKVPENIFATYVRDTCDAGKELTSANLMRIAKQWGIRDHAHSSSDAKNGHSAVAKSRQNAHLMRDLESTSAQATLFDIVGELQNHFRVLLGASAAWGARTDSRKRSRRHIEICRTSNHAVPALRNLAAAA
jgi:hypothetical protein